MRRFSHIVCMLFVLAITLPADAKVYLVSVGIADYPGTRNDLCLPVNDARAVQSLYQRNASAYTVLLTNSNATKANVISAIERTFAKAGADDIVVFFFSGHGRNQGLVMYDGILTYSKIKASFAKSASKHKMVFADACCTGKMRSTSKSQKVSVQGGSVMFFLSSRSNESSIENTMMKQALFTTALLEALRGRADADRNDVITARELFNYVSARVKRLSGNRQHPVMWGKFPDNMPVMVW